MTYQDFLDQKLHAGAAHGFEPIWMPPQLFDFQQSLVTWAIRKGRAAIEAGIIKPVPTVRLVADMAVVAGKLCQHLTQQQRIQLIDLLAPDL
jgi:hypothetical protein